MSNSPCDTGKRRAFRARSAIFATLAVIGLGAGAALPATAGAAEKTVSTTCYSAPNTDCLVSWTMDAGAVSYTAHFSSGPDYHWSGTSPKNDEPAHVTLIPPKNGRVLSITATANNIRNLTVL